MMSESVQKPEGEKFKYALLVSYKGTGYCGWQTQKHDEHSIQQTVEKTLKQITGEDIRVISSGRTDAGVHAVGQVAHLIMQKREWDPRILRESLNSLLPISIRILRAKRVPIEFHAQKSAIRKQYSYYFQQGPCALPHLEPCSRWIRKRLDLEAMNAGLAYLRGEHDFKPFQGAGAKPGPTVRKIFEAEVHFEPLMFPLILEPEAPEFGWVRLRVVGSGFLKHMVRGIAGTLLQVGERRRPPEDFEEIIRTGDRLKVGPTAPGRALWLEKVWYPEEYGLWS